MPREVIAVGEMGAIARELLSQDQAATMIGVTGRGAFLSLASGWVIFLSPEADRGPLTLNCPGQAANLKFLKSGAKARIQQKHIYLPQAGLLFDTDQAVTWEAPPTNREVLPPARRKVVLQLVARHALQAGKTSPVSELLPILFDSTDQQGFQGNILLKRIERLRRNLQDGEIVAAGEEMRAFLGLGAGLTPSGDDLALGLMLALARWGHSLAPALDLKGLSDILLPLAYQNTTTLSANLIECASQGQAHERLLLALDGLLTGDPDPAACAAYLAGWGNTSGLDALVGMGLAMACL